jgi:hypothetical protein
LAILDISEAAMGKNGKSMTRAPWEEFQASYESFYLLGFVLSIIGTVQ